MTQQKQGMLNRIAATLGPAAAGQIARWLVPTMAGEDVAFHRILRRVRMDPPAEVDGAIANGTAVAFEVGDWVLCYALGDVWQAFSLRLESFQRVPAHCIEHAPELDDYIDPTRPAPGGVEDDRHLWLDEAARAAVHAFSAGLNVLTWEVEGGVRMQALERDVAGIGIDAQDASRDLLRSIVAHLERCGRSGIDPFEHSEPAADVYQDAARSQFPELESPAPAAEGLVTYRLLDDPPAELLELDGPMLERLTRT